MWLVVFEKDLLLEINEELKKRIEDLEKEKEKFVVVILNDKV